MLCVCVEDVMDVVFSVCIMRRGAVGGLLMLVEDAIGDHTEEAYSRAGLITAL